jgi:hypothetical protein
MSLIPGFFLTTVTRGREVVVQKADVSIETKQAADIVLVERVNSPVGGTDERLVHEKPSDNHQDFPSSASCRDSAVSTAKK